MSPQPHLQQQDLVGITPGVDEAVYLIGRPPIGEYLGFMDQTLEGAATSREQLMDRWRAANDRIRTLERTEAGVADDAATTGVPEAVTARAEALVADPIVRASYQVVPIEIAMVELDRLVVFQKHVRLSHVERLQESLPSGAGVEDIFDFALPTDGRYGPTPQAGQLAQAAWCFTSPSTDLRVLEVKVLDPRAVAGATSQGRPAAILAVVVGYGANLLSAFRFEDRLVLSNGSHRAYALRAAGQTHVPCLIQNVSRREELDMIANPDVLNNLDLYMKAPRPPVLKDYFDEQLRVRVHVPSVRRQVTANVQVQALDVPGS